MLLSSFGKKEVNSVTQFQINFVKLLARKQEAENKRISLSDVSESTGIAYTTLQRWERGEISRIDFAIVQPLCDYFNCKMSDLIQYSPPQSSQQTAKTAISTAPTAA